MAVPESFRALRIRNYRRYFIGQVISLCGTWAQTIGMSWLVLDLSNDSGVAVGIVTAMQFVPVLLFGMWMGVLADRFDKRRFIVVTQIALASCALVLSIVDFADVVNLPMVYGLAFLFGVATAADTPARLSFVVEMVGPTDLPNALALNSAVVNAGRIIGPAIAGAVIAAGGTGFCFLVNAVSYVGTIVAVSSMRAHDLQQPPPVRKARGQIREALGYVWSSPILRSDVMLMGCLGFVALNFNVVLPVLAKVTFHGSASTYSWMASAMGVGALVSALVLATLDRPYGRRLIYANSILAVALLAAALMPTLLGVVAVMIVLGAGQVIGASSANALLQLDADPAVRGRCTALFSMTTSSATLFGGLLAGVITEAFGARWALAFGSVGTVVVVLAFAPVLFRDHADAPGRRQASPIPAAT
ncbi:MAG: MFS transporter [Acidimicrobiia bacterium]